MRVWWDVATSASDAFFIVKLSPFLYLLTACLSSSLLSFLSDRLNIQHFTVVSKKKHIHTCTQTWSYRDDLNTRTVCLLSSCVNSWSCVRALKAPLYIKMDLFKWLVHSLLISLWTLHILQQLLQLHLACLLLTVCSSQFSCQHIWCHLVVTSYNVLNRVCLRLGFRVCLGLGLHLGLVLGLGIA